jgi:hypothetical protein
MATGFGDAEIVAADAGGLAAGACASGALDGLHPAKKDSGKKIAAEMSCFIKRIYFSSFANWAPVVKSLSLRRQRAQTFGINYLLLHKR